MGAALYFYCSIVQFFEHNYNKRISQNARRVFGQFSLHIAAKML